MYTDEEILYHAFKISQTRDDQLMHAGWTKKIATGMKNTSDYVRSKDGRKEIKDHFQYEQAYELDPDTIDKFIKERARYYVQNMPKNLEGVVKTYRQTDAYGAGASPTLVKAYDQWRRNTKTKILDELHRKFNNPRNPYITKDINDDWNSDIEYYIDDAIDDYFGI